MKSGTVTVIGGGLAGSEAAWQAARRGVQVQLHEMRPVVSTPAHTTGRLAELVCSNSLKSADLSNAHGLLKAELRLLGSLIIDLAVRNRVPAGAALAVDRKTFPEAVTSAVENDPRITVIREEVTVIPDTGPVVLAVGPLVADAMADAIAGFTGTGHLYFHDAIAPVIDASTIDRSIVFAASRWGKGGGADYLNCPMGKEEYERFIDALLAGELAKVRDFDSAPYFEGCLPVEELARRGRDTPRFGPMKPVGLTDPRSGKGVYAIVQLRQDNHAAEQYSMVGFQTRLRQAEQRRIFRMIPGLQDAGFVRLGQVHRNSYINAPAVLQATLQARRRPDLFFAGQISGVEGYTEAAATGLLAGINAARIVRGLEPLALPEDTMLGALCRYICNADPDDYQPTNATFGLLPPPPPGVRRRKDRKKARANRALRSLEEWMRRMGEGAVPEAAP